MSAADHLASYAEGWATGNGETILGATSDGFVFDDPQVGQVSRDGFLEVFSKMKDSVETIRGADHDGPFMDLTEVVTQAAADKVDYDEERQAWV